MAGLVMVLALSACWGLAYLCARREAYGPALALVFLSGCILRLFVGSDAFLNPWDERYHALVARNLLAHPFIPTLYDTPIFAFDYRSWSSNHIWVHKPPLTLWLIAASLRLCGISEVAVRLPSIVLSSLGTLLTYGIARHFFREKTALLAAFFYAINGLLLEMAGGRVPTDHVETLFVFFVELGVLAAVWYVQRPSAARLALVGAVTGCAVLTKSLPALVILAVLFVLLGQRDSWRKALGPCALALAVAGAVAVPWQIYVNHAFPREAAWENYFNIYRHVREPLEGHHGTVAYHLLMMPQIFGEGIYLPLLLVLHAITTRRLERPLYALVTWVALPYLFFSAVATKMPGYIMMSAPAIFMLLAHQCGDILEQSRGTRLRVPALIMVALLIVLPVRYCMERAKPFSRNDRDPRWAQELRALPQKLRPGRAALFNVQHEIEAMFYAPVTAYRFVPTRAQVAEARRQGFRVYVYDSPAVPSELRADAGIILLPRPSGLAGEAAP
jgi:4-amino-4-deoxy-L-arabinose transferase-like glycosyltransferase